MLIDMSNEDREQLIKDVKRIIRHQKKQNNSLERLLDLEVGDLEFELMKTLRDAEYIYHFHMGLCRYFTFDNMVTDDEAQKYFTLLKDMNELPYPKIEVQEDKKITYFLPPARSKNFAYRKKKSKEPIKRMVKFLTAEYEKENGNIRPYKRVIIHIENHIARDDCYGVDPDNIDFKRMIDGLVPEVLVDDSYRNVTLIISSIDDEISYTKMVITPLEMV